MTPKSISIKGAERRFGGCARKAVELTSGGLCRVSEETEGVERFPDRGAGVSRGRSRRVQSVCSIGTLAREGRNGQGSQDRERRVEGPNGREGR